MFGVAQALSFLSYRGAERDEKGNKLQRQKILSLYILFIIIIGGILVLYIYNKTSIKRNILTIKQNTSGSRSG